MEPAAGQVFPRGSHVASHHASARIELDRIGSSQRQRGFVNRDVWLWERTSVCV
jgi:hypothetical protein